MEAQHSKRLVGITHFKASGLLLRFSEFYVLCHLQNSLIFLFLECMCRWVHVCEQTRRGPRSTLRAIPQEPSTTLLFETGSLSPWSSPSKLHWPAKESWGPACLHPHSGGATNAHHDVRLFDVGSGVRTSVLMLARQTPYSLSYLHNPVPISLKGGYLHIDRGHHPPT